MRISDLDEGIVGPGEIPKKFWLVLDVDARQGNPDPENVWEQKRIKKLDNIAKGELEGVRGISDSKQIMVEWFTVARNAVILMDPNEVIRQNDIEKIDYHDPDGLCANNFRMLKRLFNKEGGYDDGLMINIGDYFLRALRPLNPELHHWMHYYGFSRFGTEWSKEIKSGTASINSVRELADWIERHISHDIYGAWDTRTLKPFVNETIYEASRKAIRKMGQVYELESEWMIHSSHFHIPQGSTMLLAINVEAAREFEAWIEAGRPMTPKQWMYENHEALIKTVQKYRLGDYYKIKLVDGVKFSNLRPRIMANRQKG